MVTSFSSPTYCFRRVGENGIAGGFLILSIITTHYSHPFLILDIENIYTLNPCSAWDKISISSHKRKHFVSCFTKCRVYPSKLSYLSIFLYSVTKDLIRSQCHRAQPMGWPCLFQCISLLQSLVRGRSVISLKNFVILCTWINCINPPVETLSTVSSKIMMDVNQFLLSQNNRDQISKHTLNSRTRTGSGPDLNKLMLLEHRNIFKD